MFKFFLFLVFSCVWIADSYAQVTTDAQVRETFDFVFGEGAGSRLGTITNKDKQKASLFIRELVRGSCAMSYAEALTRKTLIPKSSVLSIVKSLAFVDCPDDIKNGKIYEVIRNQLALNWKSAFEVRVQVEPHEWVD